MSSQTLGHTLFDLKGKTALVTGGTQGIGAAIVNALCSVGASVIVNGRNEEKLNQSLSTLKASNFDVHGCLFDIKEPKVAEEAINRIEAEIGPIDILVNNAGIIRRAPAEELDEQDWNDVIQTNLTGAFLMSKFVGRNMIRRKSGKIINVCSLMSELGRDTVVAYSAAKGGLKMLTRNLATEWAPYNIQINGIGPGYIATPINESYRVAGNPLNDYIISRTPAGRWGTPEDLMGAAIFLASHASDFINGHIIYVDGGLLTSFGKPFDK
jgi:gluconate 5-dehydrogenase